MLNYLFALNLFTGSATFVALYDINNSIDNSDNYN